MHQTLKSQLKAVKAAQRNQQKTQALAKKISVLQLVHNRNSKPGQPKDRAVQEFTKPQMRRDLIDIIWPVLKDQPIVKTTGYSRRALTHDKEVLTAVRHDVVAAVNLMLPQLEAELNQRKEA